MSFVPRFTGYCQKCGQPCATVYKTKVPAKILKIRYIVLCVLVEATYILNFFYIGSLPVTVGDRDFSMSLMWGYFLGSIAFFIFAAVVIARAVRPRNAHVAVCTNCKSFEILDDPPPHNRGWNEKELLEEILRYQLYGTQAPIQQGTSQNIDRQPLYSQYPSQI